MQEHEENSGRLVKVPSLIAWISLCLLAAAWGHSLDLRLQVLWAQLGAFGLAAALGLECIQRMRKSRAHSIRNRAVRARMESGLSRMGEESATLDSINAAVRRLTDHVVSQRRLASSNTSLPKRHREAQLLGEYPLELTPVGNVNEDSSLEAAPTVPGRTRQISSTAISFEHVEPLNAQIVLATFNLKKGERLSFVVDVIWTEKTAGGLVSGGTLLAAGVPRQDCPQPEAALAAGR